MKNQYTNRKKSNKNKNPSGPYKTKESRSTTFSNDNLMSMVQFMTT